MKKPFARDDVEVIDLRTPYAGYFRIDRYRLRHRRFEGGWTDPMVREIFERGHAVAIQPYDPLADRVVMIEQFRPGAFSGFASSPFFAADRSPWLVESVAGIVEDGETPEEVARREMLEEAGLHVLDLVHARSYLVSPGGSSETVSIFVARVDSAEAEGHFGLHHEGEDIRVLTLPADEAFAWVDSGRIVNSMTIIALDWLRLHRDGLRQRWTANSSE